MDLRKKMDRIEQLRREIVELDGELKKVEYVQEEVHFDNPPRLKLASGFMMLYDDEEKQMLESCGRQLKKGWDMLRDNKESMFGKDKGIAFEEINLDGRDDEFEELKKKSGMKTVPQIFIDDKLVGGFQELSAFEATGELDRLLNS